MRGTASTVSTQVAARPARGAGVGAAGRLLCLLAGGCDLATGVLLISAPAFVLSLLGTRLPEGSGAAVFVRYVGVFVAAVGVAYLYPLVLGRLRPDGGFVARRVPTVIEVTALMRACVALFVLGAVATGSLGLAWLTVGAVDGGVAALQLRMLARGAFGRG